MYQNQPNRGQNQNIVYTNLPNYQNQIPQNYHIQNPNQTAQFMNIQNNPVQIQYQNPIPINNNLYLQNNQQLLNARANPQIMANTTVHHQPGRNIQTNQVIQTQLPQNVNVQKHYNQNNTIINQNIINPQNVINRPQEKILHQPVNMNQDLNLRAKNLSKEIDSKNNLKISLGKNSNSGHIPKSQSQPIKSLEEQAKNKQNEIEKGKENPSTENLNTLPDLRGTAVLSPVQENTAKKEGEPANQISDLKNTAIPQEGGEKNANSEKKDEHLKKSATLMTVKTLANLPYDEYPQVKKSANKYFNIVGFGFNTYNGKIKSYNEDKVISIIDYKKPIIINGETVLYNISYFAVFDGHGGNQCSIFLKESFHKILFSSVYFPYNPIEAIRESFKKAEIKFQNHAIKNGLLVDKSGSCALIALIINNTLYMINLGDSRALYSRDGGKKLYQITRDHKPNDDIEKKRIEKHGGTVYYANKQVINGVEVTFKEEDFGKNFTFPYRLSPSGLAVSFLFI